MKLNHLTTLLAILATLVFATACGEDEAESTTTTTETAPEADEDTEAPAQGGGEAAGGSVCARAVTCCEAYFAAVPTPGMTADTLCAGVRQMNSMPAAGTDGCTAAITGWRTGLQAQQQTVPAACAE